MNVLLLGRWIVLLFCASLIAACSGGGGGGGGANAGNDGGGTPFADPDGLGLTGQAAGTFVASANPPPGARPTVRLDDQARVLVVWSVPFEPSKPLMWQESGANQEQWNAPAALDPAPSFTLRANAGGDAVLGVGVFSSLTPPTLSPVSSVRRHAPAAGWTAPPDVPNSAQIGFDGSSDLALLDDGSIVLSRAGPATTVSGAKTHSFRILRHREPAGWETLIETPPWFAENPFSQRSYLAANENGTAMFYWIHTETPTPFQEPVHTLNLQFVDLKQKVALGVLPFAQGQYLPCERAFSPLTAADSPRFKVLAVMHRGQVSPDTNCDLDVIRIDFGGPIIIRPDRLNPPGTFVDGLSLLAMNQQGDAIVIWQQEMGVGILTTSLLWSQSLQGGPWSAPQPVVPPTAGIGDIDFQRNITFAANNNGQVVGIAGTQRNGRNYLTIGRFSFATGWTWQLAANMIGFSGGVAINSAGTGLLVYNGRPCRRSSDPGGFSLPTCGPAQTYALRF